MSGRIVKLQNKNVLNPFDPSGDTELNLFPVSVIKGIYDEDNLRLDRALQKIAVYNVSLGDVKSGTTTQYDAISNAIEAVYLEATNKSTLAKINPGSLISFLDKDNKYELWQYNSALTDETSIKNADNWVKLESSGDLSDIVKRIVALETDNTANKANITTLFSTCASLSQAITDIKVDIANLKVEDQKREDSKVDKYSTSHYYNIKSSKYSYTLQRIVSVPDNDSIYGTIEMSFSGRSGYSIYNDLLFMNTDESQKVISLVTDLFYTITEMIDSKQYVTLCAMNQYNPRNPFQFNIDISKYSSAYNKTIEITGDNRPDKSFIWYDDTNSTNRNLNLSDVTSAIAAGDYTKYLSYKKGLVIKSSFATSDLNSVDACTLTITSADDTNGYKGADFVQYKDFIVKWDISSNGGLSKIKLLSHTTTSTDELGNTTSSTSYYDPSKIYRISPTKTMSNFILVGPADATNTASNDNVVLIDYESITPAGSIITLTPPASSTETWLIDVKTPDIYAKENSIVVSQDTEGKSAIGRDVRKTTFKTSYDTFDKLETYLKTRLTDSWKYIPIIKIPFDGKSLHCHFGLSMSIAFTSMDPQFSGDLFLNVNKSDFYSETYSSYVRFNFIGHIYKRNISSTLADDVIVNIAVMFADKDDNFLTTSNNITSDVKYAYICLLGFSYDSTTDSLSNYITEGSISLYDVPDGTITANESTESTDLMYGIKGLKSLTYINSFPMYASCFCSDYYINKILTQCNNLETSKQDKLTFDVTPTDGSLNPVTSDGISAVLKKKCSIVSEITVAEQTNLSNPVDRGIYIIKKTDSTSTTPEYGSVDSFGGSCLLPHLAIYYKDSDGIFKHAHLQIGETESYTSITISSNILTLTKNDGSVETITLPTSTTTDHYKGQVGFSKVSSINKTTLVNEDYYLVCPDSQTSITVTSVNGPLTYTTPFLMKYLKRDAISASGIAAIDGYTIMSMEPQSGATSGSVTVYNLSYDGATRYNSVSGTEFEIIGHRTSQGGVMIGDYSSNSSAAAKYALTIGDRNIVNGTYGLAIGNTNTVNGSKGIASGYNNQVFSESSLGIGNGNIDNNSATYSFNFGSVNKMYAQYSFNFGYGNINNSEYSFNFGYTNTNNAKKSYLFGDNNTNGGEYSLLFGFYNTIATASNYGTAIGYKNTVNAVNSFAIGFQNTANYWGSSPTEASWAFGSGLTSGGNYGQFALGKYNAEIAADVAFAFGFGSSTNKKTIATIRTDGGLKLAGGLTRVPKYLSTYDLTANANKVYLSAHYEAVKITNGTTLAGVEASNGTVYSPGESVVIMGTFSYTANSVTTSVTSGAMVFVYNGSAFVKVS